MKKKGFTLIELLAVILILAIIAIIAVPAVLNTIEDSKKAAAEASARNIINAAETHYVKEIMQGIKVSKIDLTKGVLKYDGDQAEIGYVSLDDNGKGSGKMYISGYCVTAVSKSEISSEKVDIEDCETDSEDGPLTYANGTAIYYNPETNMKCTEKEAHENTSDNTGCLKWYTFLDEGSDSINLILSHNTSAETDWLTKEDYIASGKTEEDWNNYEVSKKPLTALKQLKSDISTWSADAKNTARLIEKKEIDEIVKGKEVEDTDYYFHMYDDYENLGYHNIATTGQNNFAWLFDNTNNCIEFGCNVKRDGIYGYWTSTKGTYNESYFVYFEGQISSSNYSYYGIGIRPVIRVLKSVISPEKTSIVYASTRNLMSAVKTYFYDNERNLTNIDLEKVKLTYSGEQVKKGILKYDMYGNTSGRVYIGGYCVTVLPDGVIELNKVAVDKCNFDVHTLKFTLTGSYYDGGYYEKDLSPRLYDSGSEITSLPTLNRKGYKFLGWYTTDDEKIENRAKITKDLELFDKWEVNSYTFTLVYNDGTTQNTTIKVEYGSKITSLPTPTKTGYKFLGWFTAGGNVISNGQYYYTAEDKILYANYEKEGINGVAVYYNPVTNTKCTEAEANKNTSKNAGCMKWYKFLDEDSSTAKVKLILDHNTTYYVAWGPSSSKTATTANAQLATDVSKWNSAVKSTARLITVAEINSITRKTNWDNNSYKFPGRYVYNVAGSNVYGWLFDNTASCISYGCNVSNSSTYGYWTSNEESNSYAWYVSSSGELYSSSKTNSSYYGVRPVIEVARTTIS